MKSGPLASLAAWTAAKRLLQGRGWVAVLGSFACLAMVAAASLPEPAHAQRSGGYSRPSGGFKSYSPSVRRPPVSSSGGYRRAPAAPVFGGRSPGDRAMSRGRSSEALRDYRAGQRPVDSYARRPPAAGDRGWGPSPGWGPTVSRRPSSWGGDWWRGVSPRRSFGTGVLTGVALWAALNALSSSPGQAAEYFYANRNDPVYRDWRQDAERAAARDPEVAARLAELDRRLAQLERDPPETRPRPAPAPAERGGWSVWGIIFVVGGVVVLFWLWRRRRSAAPQPGAEGIGGSAASRFRVGMVLPIDPAPFLLAAGLTKIQPPDESGMISVEAIGLLRYGDVLLHRLYLPGSRSFFQLHLGPDGSPDECRYFSVIDEINPADRQEWAFWLDPAQGLIGWPSFQTKDGKLYGRVWAPGESRIPPRQIEETRQHLNGSDRRQLQAMLYGAPSGGTPPAPDTEYILVSAVEGGGQAWVEIDAGIDINPASLNLPGVSLAT